MNVTEDNEKIVITINKSDLRPAQSKSGKTITLLATNFEIFKLEKRDIMIKMSISTPLPPETRFHKKGEKPKKNINIDI